MKKLGIVGLGVVGFPLYKALQYYYDNVYGYDINKAEFNTWNDIIKTDMVFLCLPTDLNDDGRLDMSVVGFVLERLRNDKYKGLVVIKSTLRLGYITEAIRFYKKLKICVFPEWLRAKHNFPDTLMPEMIVLGGNKAFCTKALNICKWHDKTSATIFSNPEEAVMVKLIANGFASTKISFANQVMLICEQYNLDSNKIMKALRADPRCSSRYLVPGNFYSGYCLPKDTSELAYCIHDNNLFREVERINKVIKKRNKSE